MPKAKAGVHHNNPQTGPSDRFLAARQLGNGSQAIDAAVIEELNRIDRWRVARECAVLDQARERARGSIIDAESAPER
jgi:hypothetical protein